MAGLAVQPRPPLRTSLQLGFLQPRGNQRDQLRKEFAKNREVRLSLKSCGLNY